MSIDQTQLAPPPPSDKGLTDTKVLEGLRWPTPAIDLDPAVAGVPLNTLLQALQLAATDGDRKEAAEQGWRGQTPPSMQVIKSGALATTKAGTTWIASVGGITGALAAIAGVVSPFVEGVGEPVTIALIGSSALILSSVAIALALFVKGDLEARGVATAARHQGRADVAAAFLGATASMLSRKTSATGAGDRSLVDDFLEALHAYPDRIRVATEAITTPLPVLNLWRDPGNKRLRLTIGDQTRQDDIELGEITGFTTRSSPGAGDRSLVDDFLEALHAYPDRIRVATEGITTPVPVLNVRRDPGNKKFQLTIGDGTRQDDVELSEITSFTTKSPPGAGDRSLVDDFLEALHAYPDRIRVATEGITTPVPVLDVRRDPGNKRLRLTIGDETRQDDIELSEITSFTTKPVTNT